MNQGSTYIDPGFTAKDALGADLTGKVKKTNSVNTSVAKTYYINYSVTDNYGNSNSVTRTVKVVAKSTVSKISVSPNTVSIKVGAKTKLVALVDYKGNAPTISWSSNDAAVATVSSDGTVTGVKVGTAKVCATASGTASSACSSVNVIK